MRNSVSLTRPSRLRSGFLLATVAALAVAGSLAPAAGAPRTGSVTHSPATATKGAVAPGRIGKTITLAHNVSFTGDQRTYDTATDKSGATYIAWLASNSDESTLRHIHLCVIPRNAHKCAGTVKDLDPSGDSTAAGLQMLVTPSGHVTILWMSEIATVSSIFYTTATKTGPLSPETQMSAPAPQGGFLVTAAFGPRQSIWTLAAGDSVPGPLQLREGLTATPRKVAIPKSYRFGVASASLAFSGSTPIIVINAAGGAITGPVAYSFARGSSFVAFKNVPDSSAYGLNVGLVHTASGVRMVSGLVKNFYFTGVAKWTGKGFTRATELAGGLNLGGHDASTDGSGRLVDAGADDNRVVVVNLADTIHAASFSFGIGGETLAGGEPGATTDARGRGWVAWSYQGGNSTNGDTLVIAPFVLAGLHTSKTAHGRHGNVTIVGPASCLPPVSISVSVKGHPARGWKATKPTLTLDGKKVGATLNGAALMAGKTYALTSTVIFARGGSRSKVKATLKFKSCPN